jgi:hypothetical protein
MTVFSKDKSAEQGSVMIVALVMLVLLTIIGISATSTTNIETQIAGNDKFQKIAFYTADSGLPATAKLISEIMETQVQTAYTAVAYLNPDGDPDTTNTVLSQIMADPSTYVYDDGTPDLRFSLPGNNIASVDIQFDRREPIAGGGVEFAAGSEGVGTGTAGGGVAVFYVLESTGTGPGNSQSGIVASYRRVVGVL